MEQKSEITMSETQKEMASAQTHYENMYNIIDAIDCDNPDTQALKLIHIEAEYFRIYSKPEHNVDINTFETIVGWYREDVSNMERLTHIYESLAKYKTFENAYQNVEFRGRIKNGFPPNYTGIFSDRVNNLRTKAHEQEIIRRAHYSENKKRKQLTMEEYNDDDEDDTYYSREENSIHSKKDYPTHKRENPKSDHSNKKDKKTSIVTRFIYFKQ